MQSLVEFAEAQNNVQQPSVQPLSAPTSPQKSDGVPFLGEH